MFVSRQVVPHFILPHFLCVQFARPRGCAGALRMHIETTRRGEARQGEARHHQWMQHVTFTASVTSDDEMNHSTHSRSRGHEVSGPHHIDPLADASTHNVKSVDWTSVSVVDSFHNVNVIFHRRPGGQAARLPGCQLPAASCLSVCLSVCLFLVSMFACLLVVSSWERHESTSTITLWSSSAASIVQMGASRGLRGLAPPALTDLLMSYLFANQSGLLLTFDFPKADQVSPFSSVIRLTWHCLLWRSADVCIELCNSLDVDFCKVLPRLCDGSTVIHDICSSSSSSSRPI